MRRVLEEAEALVQKHLAEVDGFDHVDVLNAASRIAFAKFDNKQYQNENNRSQHAPVICIFTPSTPRKRNETVSASLDSVFPSQ